ncbi:uncharacterized protein PG986_004909 [Apiospora aurea]|uniref:2EXR domain-containing protein n=1 Tax=Apiospora aurea TaxID=335848 RepID=A0ABR1QG21_9PEZI
MASEETAPQFPLFGLLPPELRQLIWREALSVDCVWAAVEAEPKTEYLDGPRQIVREARFRMRFVGASAPPHWVGQACTEARAAMKAVFGGRPFRGPRGPKLMVGDELAVNNGYRYQGGEDDEVDEDQSQGRYYWLNPFTTVFVFQGAETRDTNRLLDGIAPSEAVRIQHLAVFRAHWAAIRALNLRLRKDCPALQTLVIDDPGSTVVHEKGPGPLRQQWKLWRPDLVRDRGPPDEARAARYARLSRPEHPVVITNDVRIAQDRERVFVWHEGGRMGNEGERRGVR